MKISLNNFFILILMMSLTTFSYNYLHILVTLITLEFLMINVIYFTYFTLTNLNFNTMFIMLLLSMMISEGVLGLTMLVYMIRSSGSDYTLLMNLMKW